MPLVHGREERRTVDFWKRGAAKASRAEAARMFTSISLQDRSPAQANLSVLRGQAGRRVRVPRALLERLQGHAREAPDDEEGLVVRESIPRRDGQLTRSMPSMISLLDIWATLPSSYLSRNL